VLLVLGFGLMESLGTTFKVLGFSLDLEVLVLVLIRDYMVLDLGFGHVNGNLERVLGLQA
jgi:hypothetical protein